MTPDTHLSMAKSLIGIALLIMVSVVLLVGIALAAKLLDYDPKSAIYIFAWLVFLVVPPLIAKLLFWSSEHRYLVFGPKPETSLSRA